MECTHTKLPARPYFGIQSLSTSCLYWRLCRYLEHTSYGLKFYAVSVCFVWSHTLIISSWKIWVQVNTEFSSTNVCVAWSHNPLADVHRSWTWALNIWAAQVKLLIFYSQGWNLPCLNKASHESSQWLLLCHISHLFCSTVRHYGPVTGIRVLSWMDLLCQYIDSYIPIISCRHNPRSVGFFTL